MVKIFTYINHMTILLKIYQNSNFYLNLIKSPPKKSYSLDFHWYDDQFYFLNNHY